MGMNETNVWVLIRRYDYLESDSDSLQATLRRVSLPTILTFAELKSAVYSCAEIEEGGSKILKVRRHDNCLIPLSALLHGSTKEKPFIIDVVGVHQFCPIAKRTIPRSYIDALKTKMVTLEKRVVNAESAIPNAVSAHIRSVEDAASQLLNCVSFLDRRLDELAPSDWKAQISSVT